MNARLVPVLIGLGTALCYYVSNPVDSPYDYTYRVAEALLQGRLGLHTAPPSWLNEFVPWNERYYSVFPLGSVCSMLPLAILKVFGVISEFPSRILVALLAGTLAILTDSFCRGMSCTNRDRWVIVVFLLFGNWLWCNSAFGGAWHIALLVAVLGQLAALHFALVRPNPLCCGAAFSLAFGNRTELLLTAPLVLLVLAWGSKRRFPSGTQLLYFCLVPTVLGLGTLAYNAARFGAIGDFGYSHIPGVLKEPWYRDGIFSLTAIPGNFRVMLIEPWRWVEKAPYLLPNPFGSSILLASPILLVLLVPKFRRNTSSAESAWLPTWALSAVAWSAILVLTFVLWCHGNTGGWQYSYRYASVLLPWFVLLFTQVLPVWSNRVVYGLLGASVLASTYAVYLFYWTEYIKP